MAIIYDMVSNEFVEPETNFIAVETRQSAIAYNEVPQLQLVEIETANYQNRLPADLAYQAFLKER